MSPSNSAKGGGGHLIEYKSEVKYLGVTIDDKLQMA